MVPAQSSPRKDWGFALFQVYAAPIDIRRAKAENIEIMIFIAVSNWFVLE